MANNSFDFKKLLDSVNSCYSESVNHSLPLISSFPDNLFNSKGLDENQLKIFEKTVNDLYLKSVCNRLLAITKIQNAREQNTELDIKEVWNLLYISILNLPDGSIISSVGSQGFLSIPLYRYRTDMKQFEFIRLHIWDDSLNQHISNENRKKFSIHSHSFHAQSWILAGSILNERYSVIKSSSQKENSLFEIKYNKTIRKVNQHTSNAVNTKIFVDVNKISKEQYFPSSSYEVDAGDYHKSGTLSEDGLSASIFSFTAKDGSVPKSFVVGPSDVKNSKINRKTEIDPTYLLNKLDEKINKLGTGQRLMILDWMRKVHQLEYAHRYESIKWSNRHLWIGYPAFIISLLIAFSFRFPWETIINDYGTHWYTNHSFYIAFFTSIVALLTGYQTFVRPNEKAVTHKNTGQHHEKIRHQLEYILTSELDKKTRNKKLEAIRKEWESIDSINVSYDNFKEGKNMVLSFKKYPEELGFIKDRIN
ncbi:SLATT domain-containing protein [Maribacter stanieri]|uniref:SLATT domain-containing protein n=1 Tax=Maribacter stanieri TaxID=440514 RepID=UPI00249576D9|nr:SLATT domain-containing protein [Maribacter stanieri]